MFADFHDWINTIIAAATPLVLYLELLRRERASKLRSEGIAADIKTVMHQTNGAKK